MDPTIGNETTAKWDGKSLGVMTDFPDINDKRDTKESTPYSSPDKRKRYLLGMFDCDELTLTFDYDPSDEGQQAFETDYANGTQRNLEITFPPELGTKIVIPCLPTGIGYSTPKDDAVSRKLSMKPNGKPVVTITESAGLTTPFFALSGSGELTPAAAGDRYEYFYTVANEVSSITLTPTFTAGVCTVNGNTVLSGAASSAIALDAGEFTDIEVEVKEDDAAPVRYLIKAFRPAA